MPEIRFVPDNIVTCAEAGENLLEVMVAAGVYINAGCGGAGVCGKCQVKIISGVAAAVEDEPAAQSKLQPGHVFACQTMLGDEGLVIEVPEASRIRKMALGATEPVVKGNRISSAELETFSLDKDSAPPVRKLALQLAEPTLEDSISDLTRLTNSLRSEHGVEAGDVKLSALREMPGALRNGNWTVTADVFAAPANRITRITPGDTSGANIALAVDVGTTSVWVQVLDVNKRKVLAEGADYNKQISFGEDVISRIIFSTKGDGLKQLQAAAVENINRTAQSLLEQTGVPREAISFVAAAGNTTMAHLLLGMDPRNIRLAPYVPAASWFPPVDACDIGIDTPKGAPLFVFPCVASYLGGDIVSGVTAYGLHKRPEMTLYMDVGTNGEIVIGNSDMMMTASCSAGPAFEGGGLMHGMRATEGAVESFAINPDNLDEPMVLTIGRKKPIGICGSGAITLLAELLQFGILQQNGKFDPDAPTRRVRQCEDGLEYVVAWKDDSGADTDITLTEPDVDNLVRAKAAMFSGCHTLLQHVGLSFDMLDRVVITGSFGNYVNPQKAVFIGLLPDVPLDKFYYIRNGSLSGARMACYSNDFLRGASAVAGMMTNVELCEAPGYMDLYMAANFLPHTDANLFPSVSEALRRK